MLFGLERHVSHKKVPNFNVLTYAGPEGSKFFRQLYLHCHLSQMILRWRGEHEGRRSLGAEIRNEGSLSTLRESPRRQLSRKIDGSDELSWRASHQPADNRNGGKCWAKSNTNGAKSLGWRGEAFCLLDLGKNAQKWGMDFIPMNWQSTMQESKFLLLEPPVSSYLHFLH